VPQYEQPSGGVNHGSPPTVSDKYGNTEGMAVSAWIHILSAENFKICPLNEIVRYG
jgi:hypothetical protein